MTTLRRLTSLLAVIAMLLTMTATSALAVVQAAATIPTGDLFAGRGGQVTVRIANNASPGIAGLGGGSTINVFQIEVPQQLVDVANVQLTTTDGTALDNWNFFYDSEVGFIVGQAKKDQPGLTPGQTMDVKVGVTADPAANDRTAAFNVFASDNGGTTMSHIGSPSVTARILQITGVVLERPATATSDANLVTADQDNAEFRVSVTNWASEQKTITADVAKKSGSSTITSTPVANSVNPGGSADFVVPVKFGATGNIVVNGSATAGTSAARVVASDSITVQAKFAANLVANSLQPKAGLQGSDVNIAYRINKTAGAQPVSATASFELDDEELSSAAQTFTAANEQKSVTIPTTLPNKDNGAYPSTSEIRGNDANGAVVSLDLNLGDFTLDDLLPVVNLTLHVGEPDVPGAPPATTSGRTITYSGSIGLNKGTGNCSNCTITKAVLVAQPSQTELPMSITNSGGTLSGSGSFTFPAGTTSAVAKLTVVRGSNGATAPGLSNTIAVDLIRPTLTSAVTFRDLDADKIIVTTFDDGLLVDVSTAGQNEGNPINWAVDNNTVTKVEGRPQANGATQIVLTLRNRLNDNATPTVSYSVALGDRIHDRVSLTMADQTVDAADGIIPEAPVLDTVNGLKKQDGEFWINDSTPDVGLTGLVAGNVLEIFWDKNDNGAPDSGERVYFGSIGASSETVTLSDLGNIEERHDLIARMVDNAANNGKLATTKLNLDFTPATIVSAVANGQQVTVTFSEPIARGRDAAFDWAVKVTDSNGTAFRTVTEVTGSGLTRVLTVSSSSWNAANGGDVTAVRYLYRGFDEATERYEDRATNDFGNTLYTKQ